MPGRAPRRPHLVVLPGGGGEPAASGGLRVTRRGRVALLALVARARRGARAGRASARRGAAEPLRTVTVAPGQTLSEVAAAELPDLSISEGILAIQLANEPEHRPGERRAGARHPADADRRPAPAAGGPAPAPPDLSPSTRLRTPKGVAPGRGAAPFVLPPGVASASPRTSRRRTPTGAESLPDAGTSLLVGWQ